MQQAHLARSRLRALRASPALAPMPSCLQPVSISTAARETQIAGAEQQLAHSSRHVPIAAASRCTCLQAESQQSSLLLSRQCDTTRHACSISASYSEHAACSTAAGNPRQIVLNIGPKGVGAFVPFAGFLHIRRCLSQSLEYFRMRRASNRPLMRASRMSLIVEVPQPSSCLRAGQGTILHSDDSMQRATWLNMPCTPEPAAEQLWRPVSAGLGSAQRAGALPRCAAAPCPVHQMGGC